MAFARVPNSPYVCVGCWLWRRARVTIPFLSGSYKDGRCAMNYSWLLAEKGAWALRPKEDRAALWEVLLKPPPRFALLLLNESGVANWLQAAVLNEIPTLEVSTPLAFTLNNQPLSYTVYDVEKAVLDDAPPGPGERALFDLYGRPHVEPKEERKMPTPTQGGRPKETEQQAERKNLKRVVRSGG